MADEGDDQASTDPGGAEETERRRLIDLTRAEKGLPERRNLRRIRHVPLWTSPDDEQPTGEAGPDERSPESGAT